MSGKDAVDREVARLEKVQSDLDQQRVLRTVCGSFVPTALAWMQDPTAPIALKVQIATFLATIGWGTKP